MVRVVGAPGYEDFEGELILEIFSPVNELISRIGDPITKEIFVIPSRYVEEGAIEEC